MKCNVILVIYLSDTIKARKRMRRHLKIMMTPIQEFNWTACWFLMHIGPLKIYFKDLFRSSPKQIQKKYIQNRLSKQILKIDFQNQFSKQRVIENISLKQTTFQQCKRKCSKSSAEMSTVKRSWQSMTTLNTEIHGFQCASNAL